MKSAKLWLDIAEEQAKEDENLTNIVESFCKYKNVEVTKLNINNTNLQKLLNKDMGVYYTVEAQCDIIKNYDDIKKCLKKVLVDIISRMNMPKNILVVGLGNRNVDVDSLGTVTSENINVKSKNLHSIMAGVYGMTGIESAKIVKGISSEINANLVIVIDTLATTKVSRIYRTFQVTNAGLTPGSATGYGHDKINRESMGLPVIAIGVPTCIYGRSLVYETMRQINITKQGIMAEVAMHVLGENNMGMLLVTKDIKEEIKTCAKIIGDTISEIFGTK